MTLNDLPKVTEARLIPGTSTVPKHELLVNRGHMSPALSLPEGSLGPTVE